MTLRIKSIATMAILTLTISLSGCVASSPTTGNQTDTSGSTTTTPSTTTPDTTTPNTTTPGTTTPSTTATESSPSSTGGQALNYQILSQAPDQLKNSIEALKKGKGYFLFPEDQVLVIFMGERSTGGYSISLKDIQAQGDTLMIEVTEKSPGPNDIVTQAFTYPMLILQLEDDFSVFKIQDQLGKAYPPVPNNLF